MLSYFRPQRGALVAAGAIGALTTLANVALLGTSGYLIARATQMPPVLHLTVAVVTVRALALTRAVGRYTERLVSHDATFASLGAMRAAVYRQVERAAPAGLAGLSRGELTWRLVGDVDRMQDLPLRVLLPGAAGIASAIVTCAAAILLLPTAGLALTLCLLAAGVLAPAAAWRAAGATQRRIAPESARLADEVMEFLDGQADAAMLGATDSALGSLAASDARLRDAGRRHALAAGAAQGIIVAATAGAVAASVWAAAHAAAAGHIGPVTTVVVGLLPLAAFETVAALPGAALAWLAVRPSAQRLAEVMHAPIAAEPAAAAHLPVPHARTVDLRDIAAGWDGRDAVYGLSLGAATGSRIALVGASGSGKSTALAVIAALLRPTHGTYLLEGVDTAQLTGVQVREHVALSLQGGHIFHTTVAENLRLAAPAGADQQDADLRAALDAVGLLDWVDTLPAGLQTVLAAGGASMSGGQRQRLLAARLIVAAPDVWLLDEPTEHLDRAAADALLAVLLERAGDATVFLATHRGAEAGQMQRTVTLD